MERGEQGYWLGAYFVNLMAVEAIFAIWITGYLVATRSTPDWARLEAGTMLLMATLPWVLFPYSKTLFLAFDLWMRPPSDADFAVPHERPRSTLQPPGGG